MTNLIFIFIGNSTTRGADNTASNRQIIQLVRIYNNNQEGQIKMGNYKNIAEEVVPGQKKVFEN